MMSQPPRADGHVRDPAGIAGLAEEQQVAGAIGELDGPPRVELHVGIARQGDSGEPVEQLGKARTVDPPGRTAAPEVRDTHKRGRVGHHLRAAGGFVLGQRGKGPERGSRSPTGAFPRQCDMAPLPLRGVDHDGRAPGDARRRTGVRARLGQEPNFRPTDQVGECAARQRDEVGPVRPTQVSIGLPYETPPVLFEQHIQRPAIEQLAHLLGQPGGLGEEAGEIDAGAEPARLRVEDEHLLDACGEAGKFLRQRVERTRERRPVQHRAGEDPASRLILRKFEPAVLRAAVREGRVHLEEDLVGSHGSTS